VAPPAYCRELPERRHHHFRRGQRGESAGAEEAVGRRVLTLLALVEVFADVEQVERGLGAQSDGETNGHRSHRSLDLAPPDPQHASPRGRRSALSILRKEGWKRKGGGCGLRLLTIQAA